MAKQPADFATLKPGVHLARTIYRTRRNGRAGWWIGPNPLSDGQLVGVPTPPVSVDGSILALNPPLGAVMPMRLALALETENQNAREQLSAGDHRAAKRLYAAALRDILGMTFPEIAEICDYAEENSALKRVKEARPVWSRVGAWPWSCFGTNGIPRDDWLHAGADERTAVVFRCWESGRIALGGLAALGARGTIFEPRV